MRKLSCIFILSFFFLWATTLYAQDKEPDNKRLNEVTLQLKWYHAFQFAGYYAADLKGFYEEAGLEVNIAEGSPNISAVEQVSSGAADFGVSDTEILIHYGNGKGLVALDATFQQSPSVFAVKAQSDINSLKELSEATVVAGSGFPRTEFHALLQAEGIDTTQTTFLSNYSFNNFIANDSIDAMHMYYTIDYPYFEQQGVNLNTFFPKMYNVDFYGDLLFTNSSFLKSSPDIVSRFREASKKGWDYARENPNEIIDYILSLPTNNEVTYSKELLTIESDRMWELYIPTLVPYGYMNPERWDRITNFYAGAGLVPEDLDLDGFLITSEESLIEQLIPTLKYILLGIVLLAVSVILWLYMLKREVKRRTGLWVKEFKERQETAKKLEATKKDYKNLVENIHDCVFQMDEEAVFMYISPNVEQITGYKPEEVIDIKYAPFFPEESLKELYARFSSRIESGVDDNAPIKINHRNGTHRWLSATTKVVEHPVDGTVVQGTFRDVTDTVRTQHALHYSEERFRKLTEQSPVGIYILSGDEYIYVNSKYSSIFGAEPLEFIGEKIDPEFIHKEDREKLFGNITKLMSGEIDKADNLYRAYKKTGEQIFIHFYSSIIEVDSDRLLFGTALEVTDQVNTQIELEEQEERFRTLTEKSFTGLVLVQDGLVIYINPRYLEIIGYSKDEINTADDLFRLTHADDIESVKKSVEDRKKGNIDHVHYQCRMYHKEGHIVYLDIYGSTVTIKGKDAIMASVMDITDIVIAQNKLEASVHEKNVLLAEIHHRVKNNMAVVSGLMELQKFKTDDKIAQSLLKESQLRIKTIAMIHEKLYQSDSFSEIPFGEYLSDLIENVANSLYKESTRIKIIEDFDDISLNINQAIPAALFTNEVITNCFKHAFPDSRDGEVIIKIKKEDDDMVRIAIKDNGVGLPKNYTESNSLGMTLIKNLSNQVGAKLSVTNGNGCGFEIYFKKEIISGSASNARIQ